MKIVLVVALVAIAGCASPEYRWEKSGASADEFHRDRGQCMQATFGMPFAGPMQQQMVFASCMQGKGWYSVEMPRR